VGWLATQRHVRSVFDRVPVEGDRVIDLATLLGSYYPNLAPASRAEFLGLVTTGIWSATFLHSWVGGRQFIDGGSVRHAPLGLQATKLSEVPTPEDDRALKTHGPLRPHAALHLALAEVLGTLDLGWLAHARDDRSRQSECAAYAGLLGRYEAVLADATAAFPKGHLTLDRIRGRINI